MSQAMFRSELQAAASALGQFRGFVSGRTSGGSIKAVDCSGGTDVRTSGGRIWLGNIGRNVTARTSGGSIQAAMTITT